MASRTLGFRADDGEGGLHDRASRIADQFDDISKSDAARVMTALGAEPRTDTQSTFSEQVEGALLNATMFAVLAAGFVGGLTALLDYALLQETLWLFGLAFFFLLVFTASQAAGGRE